MATSGFSLEEIKMEAWREELYHHQILGAHWGEMHGPPYPLAPDKHSAEQKRKNPGIFKKMAERRAAKKKRKRQLESLKKAQEAKRTKAEEAKKKAEQEEKDAKERDRVVKSGTAEEVLGRKDLSPQELQYARLRLSEQQQIMGMLPKPVIEKGKSKAEKALDKADKFMSMVKQGSDIASTGADAAKNFIKAYNVGVKIYNAKTGSNMKTIDLEPKKESWDEKIKKIQYKEAEAKWAYNDKNPDSALYVSPEEIKKKRKEKGK